MITDNFYTNIDFSAVDDLVNSLQNVPFVLSGFVDYLPNYVKVCIGLSVVSGLIRFVYNCLKG